MAGTPVLVDRIHVEAEPARTFLRHDHERGRAVWDAWPDLPLSATQWCPEAERTALPASKLRRRTE